MSSQDDHGMLWYGVSGISFNPTDPSDVMLNAGIAAPLLSDHPRALLNQQSSQGNFGSHPHHGALNYGDIPLAQNNQVFYDPQTGDYINSDYVYESYDAYEEESVGINCLSSHNQQLLNQTNFIDDESSSNHKTKKPKVHQNPALKLKTPIAYQKDTDIAAIPIMKEGMAVCEKCGAIGVKHAFYGKERKYCSLSCARPPLPNSNIPKTSIDIAKIISKVTSEYNKEPNHQIRSGNMISFGFGDSGSSVACSGLQFDKGENGSSTDIYAKQVSSPNITSTFEGDSHSKDSMDDFDGNIKSNNSDSGNSNNVHLDESDSLLSNIVDNQSSQGSSELTSEVKKLGTEDADGLQFKWESSYLNRGDFVVASVKSFKHAPMSECWDQISTGMKVEVSCGEESLMKDSFWVASVILICGFKAKLRFEGFIDDTSKDFWVDLCSEEVHPVGWCATQGKPLIPPKSIQDKYKDWKEFLMKRLTGARTLPTNFHAKINESIKSRFNVGMHLEVVDKNRIAQMRVATVTRIVGKRLHLRYHGAPHDDNGFWCHEDSAIIHPIGWSREVGHEIVASQSYHKKCMETIIDPQDATPDHFVQPLHMPFSDDVFVDGMKLEAVDPLNLASICVATIMKVLERNYLMIRIDSYDCDTTWSDWFCYHATSGNIFPAGFCETNNIPLTPPKGYEGSFSWDKYLSDTNATAAPHTLFTRDVINHEYVDGMWIEATDLMDPRLVCVAMVKEVKGRLLRIHFDGWEDDYDQWVDCHSPDIYPVGWCSLVGYKLEGPRSNVPTLSNLLHVPRRKPRMRGRRGRPFGSRRGLPTRESDTVASSLLQSVTAASSIQAAPIRRGRKPRLKAPFNLLQTGRPILPQNDNKCIFNSNLSKDEGSVNERMSMTYIRGKRGRPRRNHLRLMNKSGRVAMGGRHSLTASLQSEDDASDETSSGVASLAGSENSSDPWDMDNCGVSSIGMNENGTSKQISNVVPNQINPSVDPFEFDESADQKTESFSSKTVFNDSSILSNSQNQEVDAFLSTPASMLSEGVPLTENPSDYFVSSTLDVAFAKDPEELNFTQNTNSSSLMNSNLYSKEACLSSTEIDADTALRTPPSVSSESMGQSLPYDCNNTVPSTPFAPVPILEQSASLSENLSWNDGNSLSNQCALIHDENKHLIPRIIDSTFNTPKGSKIQPQLWSCDDVSLFMENNDCGTYCESFLKGGVDGNRLLKLGQKEVMELTGMKVGPSLKIHDLIQQLLAIVNPAQARYQATLLKRRYTFPKS